MNHRIHNGARRELAGPTPCAWPEGYDYLFPPEALQEKNAFCNRSKLETEENRPLPAEIARPKTDIYGF